MNEDDRDEINKRFAELEARIAKLEGKKKKPKAIAGDNGSALPGITEGNGSTKCPTTEQSKRVADIFHRRHTTPWSEKEIAVYKKIGKIEPETLATIEAYYKSDEQFLRRDLFTFLNNFAGEVDRAMKWKREKRTTGASRFTA